MPDHCPQPDDGRRPSFAHRRAYAERIMDRLRRHYADRDPLPSAAHDFDDSEGRESLSLPLLQRLYRCVLSEGYGEA